MEINCEKCNNNGYILKNMTDGCGQKYVISVDCDCLKQREYVGRAKKVGLGDDIFNKTFDSFEINEDWQYSVKNAAQNFVGQDKAKTFFIGGQVGCGKTHICTAIINEFSKQGKNCTYVIWNDVAIKLKQTVYSDIEQYNKYLDELKFTQVLFVDDFFKNDVNTRADIDNAFQFINMRYLNAKNEPIFTIISSEKTIKEILSIDEAVASRLYEMTCGGQFCISVSKDKSKNYRLKNIE